jgi:5'-3' exonuclease
MIMYACLACTLVRRHEMYEGYKGQRQACPEAVKEAVPRLVQLLKAMAIPVIQVGPVDEGVGLCEADSGLVTSSVA